MGGFDVLGIIGAMQEEVEQLTSAMTVTKGEVSYQVME